MMVSLVGWGKSAQLPAARALLTKHQQGLLHLINHQGQEEQRGDGSSVKAIPQLGEHQPVIPSQGSGCVGQREREG